MRYDSTHYSLTARESLPHDFDKSDYQSDSDDPLSNLVDGFTRRA